MRFREAVAAEFARRRQRNQRYSLRAFARAMGVHHATVSRLLNGNQPVQARAVRALGSKLRLSPRQVAAMIALEDAAAVVAGIARPSFHPNSRWLASVAGISVDRVNIAIESLLRRGQLRMPSATRWQLTQ